MKPIVYFRSHVDHLAEEEACTEHFPVVHQRTKIPPGSLVIPRYSALPFFDELHADITQLQGQCIQSPAGHRYIAELSYYFDMEDLTFPTYFRMQDVPSSLHAESFIVKGATNSRKQEWHKKMFAKNFSQAVHMACELQTDGLIGAQNIVLRRYEPLESFDTSVGGCPMANEWRVFFYKNTQLAHGYYWGAIDNLAPVRAAEPEFLDKGLALAIEASARIGDFTDFYAIDVAKTQKGQWRVVEVNDGMMSGLNGTIDPHTLYSALARALSPSIRPKAPGP